MSDAKALADFYRELARLQAKRDAAYEERHDDPAGWKAAKEAYDTFRGAMRLLDVRKGDESSPAPEAISAAGAVHKTKRKG